MPQGPLPVNSSEFVAQYQNLGQSVINQLPIEQVAVYAAGGTHARTLADWFGDIVNVRGVGVTGTGDDTTNFIQAAAVAAANNATLLISGVRVRLASAAGTISVPIRFEGTGAIDTTAGGTVTIAGPILAANQQIFYGTGVTFNAKVDAIKPVWWGTVGNGVADDTQAIRLALLATGSRIAGSIPTTTFAGQLTNAQQGYLLFEKGAKYKISDDLPVPPGATINLNGSTIIQTNSAKDAFVATYVVGWPFYAHWFTRIYNGMIQGPGKAVSTGAGVFGSIWGWCTLKDLMISGFKFGLRLWEVQYSAFINVRTDYNRVGKYITARPDGTTLSSLDNYFASTSGGFNDYGLWLQASGNTTFDRPDYGRSVIVDVLFGSELIGYLPTYTVVSGGSGYTPNAAIAATITDATGTNAEAVAFTNGAGVVNSVKSIDSGTGYTAPTIAIPGGGVAAVVTAAPVSDTGIGDWSGNSSIIRGHNVFNNLKIEHSGDDRPLSGYGVIVNGLAHRGNVFNDLDVAMQSGSAGTVQYYRWILANGPATFVNNPYNTSGGIGSISNPANGDVSIFKAAAYDAFTIHWPRSMGSLTNHSLLVKWTTGALADLAQIAWQGFNPNGQIKGFGYEAENGFAGNDTYLSRVAGEAQPRFKMLTDGTLRWGPGGGGAVDTGVARLAANVAGPESGSSLLLKPSTPTLGVQGSHIYMGSAAPLAGTFVLGDVVVNNAPAVGQPKGWRCTVAGTPGTWVSEGNL